MRLGEGPLVTRMLKDGIQRLRFLRRTVARMVRRAEMWGGSSRSISRPARVSLLTKPEMARIDSIAARMRNRRSAGGEDSGEGDDDDGSADASPVRVTCWRRAPGQRVRRFCHQVMPGSATVGAVEGNGDTVRRPGWLRS